MSSNIAPIGKTGMDMSAYKEGEDILSAPNGIIVPESPAGAFIECMLERVPEMTAFLNPIANSYACIGTGDTPHYVSWSHQNRSQLVCIPTHPPGARVRME